VNWIEREGQSATSSDNNNDNNNTAPAAALTAAFELLLKQVIIYFLYIIFKKLYILFIISSLTLFYLFSKGIVHASSESRSSAVTLVREKKNYTSTAAFLIVQITSRITKVATIVKSSSWTSHST
jgi:hypothetical protein